MHYRYVFRDRGSYCKEFLEGLDFFKKGKHEQALSRFQLAYESVNARDDCHNKYASFCGLLRAMQGDYGGLILCHDAARSEYYDADVYLNLARAEYWLNNRKRAVEAIIKGLCIDSNHPGLLELQQELGIRKRNPLPLLGRKNCLNVMIGKAIRRKRQLSD